MKSTLPWIGIVGGLALILLGMFWSSMFPATRSWNEEKSNRLSELGSEANKLKFALITAKNNPSMKSGENPAELQARFDEVMQEHSQLQAELDSAIDSPGSTGSALRWTGILAAVAGVLFLVANRQDA